MSEQAETTREDRYHLALGAALGAGLTVTPAVDEAEWAIDIVLAANLTIRVVVQ